MNPIIIQTTFNDKSEAKRLIHLLLEKKLCACAQIQEIDSFYTWKDEMCEDKEYLINIKTKNNNYKIIKREIKENHSYDVPEIIAIEIDDGSKSYLKWLEESC
jgi:periplasmic divalent cation tolerance protein